MQLSHGAYVRLSFLIGALLVLFACPLHSERAFAQDAPLEIREALVELMDARGMGMPDSAEILLDRKGNPSFIIGVSKGGYLVADLLSGAFLEQGCGAGPYSAVAEARYYGGFGCYAEKRDGQLRDAVTGLPIESVPYSPAIEEYVQNRRDACSAGGGEANSGSVQDEYTCLLGHTVDKVKRAAFGLNDYDESNEDAIPNTCTAIALSIALNYLDYTLDDRIVQTGMELEDRIPDASGDEHYPKATAFHRYLVEDCSLCPEYVLGITIGVFGAMVEDGLGTYMRSHVDSNAVGLGMEWSLFDEGWIEASVERDYPALITTTFVAEGQYNFHTMVAYGYRQVDGITTEINLHSGWRNSAYLTESGTGALLIGDIWLPADAAAITYVFDVSDGLHCSGSGEHKYYEDNEPVKSAWRTVDGYSYYFDENGLRAVGWKWIGGQRYHFDSNGVRTTGYYTENGTRYYFDGDGVLVSQAPVASPLTGPSDGAPLTALQAAYQGSLQRTAPDAIPSALERAMQANPDVFGWLHVPGTKVSLPLAWREGDVSFYLDHDSLGNESAIGCAYTTGGAGMSDAVTVVYGHSFASGDLAFTSLHAFEDAAFFAGHDRAYVYLPGRRLEYRVAGAYLFNARAIEGVDQSDPADLGDYFAELSSPDPSSFVGYKRRGALDPERDRVLQLSTCTVPADPALRFVVTCVYAGEEEL